MKKKNKHENGISHRMRVLLFSLRSNLKIHEVKSKTTGREEIDMQIVQKMFKMGKITNKDIPMSLLNLSQSAAQRC